MKFCIELSNRELLRPSWRRDISMSLRACFRLRRFFPPSAPMYLSMACRLAPGYNGSRGPWLQWVPWPMVTMGPVAHGYNRSRGPWLQWVPWPMVTMGPMAHGYNGPNGPWLQWAPWPMRHRRRVHVKGKFHFAGEKKTKATQPPCRCEPRGLFRPVQNSKEPCSYFVFSHSFSLLRP